VHFLRILLIAVPVFAQARLDPDAPGCTDSKTLPRLLSCRIDNCESKDGDHRDIQVRDDEKGEPVAVDGNSRTVMYECAVEITPADIVARAATALRAFAFEVPYQFSDKEGALTAHKGDLWITMEAASHFYTLTELTVTAPDYDSIVDAPGMAEALDKYGKAPLYGITFLTGRADITPESVITLREVIALMNDNPDLRVRVTGHTDSTGTKTANSDLSFKRAQSVVDYLVRSGIKRARLEAAGAGDSEPVADNSTEAGRLRNRRIELGRLDSK
jgi:OmpA family